jgi:hypothetical protein
VPEATLYFSGPAQAADISNNAATNRNRVVMIIPRLVQASFQLRPFANLT